MKLTMDEAYLDFYEALASRTRLKIIKLLAKEDMYIKEIAQELSLSSSIITKHMKKLEKAGIISTTTLKEDGNLYKVSTLLNNSYEITVPVRSAVTRVHHLVDIPVGQYSDILVTAPCGMASETHILGDLDKPLVLLDPIRQDTQLLWFTSGFVEYKVPNYVYKKQYIEELEISGEFSSEAAGYCEDWPSDITFQMNSQDVCDFSTPGDFGELKGSLTPAWWEYNQYGILVIIKITNKGTYINGQKASEVSLSNLNLDNDRWTLGFGVKSTANNVGGLTIFGEKFGCYQQSIRVKTFYKPREDENMNS